MGTLPKEMENRAAEFLRKAIPDRINWLSGSLVLGEGYMEIMDPHSTLRNALRSDSPDAILKVFKDWEIQWAQDHPGHNFSQPEDDTMGLHKKRCNFYDILGIGHALAIACLDYGDYERAYTFHIAADVRASVIRPPAENGIKKGIRNLIANASGECHFSNVANLKYFWHFTVSKSSTIKSGSFYADAVQFLHWKLGENVAFPSSTSTVKNDAMRTAYAICAGSKDVAYIEEFVEFVLAYLKDPILENIFLSVIFLRHFLDAVGMRNVKASKMIMKVKNATPLSLAPFEEEVLQEAIELLMGFDCLKDFRSALALLPR